MKHDLSPRAQVAALKLAGHSQRQTADVIRKPLSFVKRWWNRDELLDRHAGGKPLKLTRSLITGISKRLKNKQRTSTRLIARAMGVAQSTVQRGAKLGGLFPYHRARKLILTAKQVKARLAWAREYKNQDWSKVLFTDEKIVYCVPRPNTKTILFGPKKGTDVLPYPHDRHSAKLNVSAAVWLNGRSSIFIFKENLVSSLYINALKNTVLKEGAKIPGGGWEVLLDNDPKHTSKLTKAFLEENHVRKIHPKPRSPDVNIVENVWPMLDQELLKLGPLTASNLENKIKLAWRRIPQESIRNCVLSMPHRLELIRKAHGGHIKY